LKKKPSRGRGAKGRKKREAAKAEARANADPQDELVKRNARIRSAVAADRKALKPKDVVERGREILGSLPESNRRRH
jgi:hypothetical protein